MMRSASKKYLFPVRNQLVFFFQSKPVGTLISTLIMFDMISIQFVFVILFFYFCLN